MAANAYFEMGSGPIWIDNFQCEDHETSFAKCSFNAYGVNNCVHEKDAVVMCNV